MGCFAMLVLILSRVPDSSLRRLYLRQCWGILKARRNAIVTSIYVFRCALHYHLHQLARTIAAGGDRPVNTF
jgi:hypothetical protein